MIITIDGPTASGKSTVGRMLAHQLGYYYLNSGLLYRAVAYLLMHDERCTHEQLATVEVAVLTYYTDPSLLIYRYDDGISSVLFNNVDITAQLITEVVGLAASTLGTNEYARQLLTTMQQRMVHDRNSVIDGRDAGSVVCKDADYKFFLTSPVAVRAQRWLSAQRDTSREYSTNQVIDRITQRDRQDTERRCAPLHIAKDVIVIDSEAMTAQETVDYILRTMHGVHD